MRVELEKQKGIVTNAESKFSEMGEETGENRKAIAEAARGLVKANADAAKTQDSLRELNDQLTEARKRVQNRSHRRNRRTRRRRLMRFSPHSAMLRSRSWQRF